MYSCSFEGNKLCNLQPSVQHVGLSIEIDRGVRHGAVRRTRFRNPVDFRWISGFQFGFLDFWISK